MTDIELLNKLEGYLKKADEKYKSLPAGYEQAKAKGKRDGLEMAIFHIQHEFMQRGTLS